MIINHVGWIYLGSTKIYLRVPSFLDTKVEQVCWNLPSSKTGACLWCIAYAMAADTLATQGARSFLAIVLALFLGDIPVLVQRESHIETETKWPPFRRRYFEGHFLERKLLNVSYNFLQMCSLGLIDNMAALVQIMAWRRTGDKPSSEPMTL